MKMGGGEEAGKQGGGWQQRDCLCVALKLRLYLQECLCAEYKNFCIFGSVCGPNTTFIIFVSV